MRRTLLLACLLIPLLSLSQPSSISWSGKHGYFFSDSLTYKLTDSLLTLRSLRTFTDSLELRSTSLERKLTMCLDLDRFNTAVIDQQQAALEADKKLQSLNLIEVEGLKNENKGLRKENGKLQIKSTVYGTIIIGGLIYVGINLLNN